MEKIMYHVWKSDAVNDEAFKETLLGSLAERLSSEGVRSSRVAVQDDHVANVTSVQIASTRPKPNAVVSVWVDSANDYFRAGVDAAIAAHTARMHAYLVSESEPMRNTQYPEEVGKRAEGMNQIVFLRKPDWLEYFEWLAIWRNSHSFVGIGTQSTYAYRQNLVTRRLTHAAPHYHAFIEEQFPEPSCYDDAHYYDEQAEKAEIWDKLVDLHYPEAIAIRKHMAGKPRWEINFKIMQESVKRFIDIGQSPNFPIGIDCTAYSDYILTGPQ